jgi:hypothetical protein
VRWKSRQKCLLSMIAAMLRSSGLYDLPSSFRTRQLHRLRHAYKCFQPDYCCVLIALLRCTVQQPREPSHSDMCDWRSHCTTVRCDFQSVWILIRLFDFRVCALRGGLICFAKKTRCRTGKLHEASTARAHTVRLGANQEARKRIQGYAAASSFISIIVGKRPLLVQDTKLEHR